MEGGTLESGNVRLMHVHCNRVDYSNLALEAHLLSLRDEDDQPLDDRAVDVAMETHLRLLAENSGRLPKGRSSYESASRDAYDAHASLRGNNLLASETPLLDRWRSRSSSIMREAAAAARQQAITNQPDESV